MFFFLNYLGLGRWSLGTERYLCHTRSSGFAGRHTCAVGYLERWEGKAGCLWAGLLDGRGELGAEAPEGCRERGRRCPLWGLAGLRSSPGVCQRPVIAVCHGFLHVGRGQSFPFVNRIAKLGLFSRQTMAYVTVFSDLFCFCPLPPCLKGV